MLFDTAAASDLRRHQLAQTTERHHCKPCQLTASYTSSQQFVMTVTDPDPSPETGQRERQQVYQVIHRIPPGRLCSYGAVAAMAGLPGRARWVGRLLSQLPGDTLLPWYRVVNSQGRISFPEGSESYQRQLEELVADGSAAPSGRIFWRHCRWPDQNSGSPNSPSR